MTEAEWLGCEEPEKVLEFLRRRTSERKLRLFACACWRHVLDWLRRDWDPSAVEVAERFADGLASGRELRDARGAEPTDPLGWDKAVSHPDAYHAAALSYAWAVGRRGTFVGTATYERPGERPAQAILLRELFGNPFRPVTPNPLWLAWDNGTVRRIAEAIYEERAFDRLPILADALEDAGCADADILTHCRGPGEHVRRCWVVDLLLGKT